MIETKEQVIEDFTGKARAFLDQPNIVTGMELDDAVVTLKRFVLSQLADQDLASVLTRYPKLIRVLDVDGLRALVDATHAGLQRHKA